MIPVLSSVSSPQGLGTQSVPMIRLLHMSSRQGAGSAAASDLAQLCRLQETEVVDITAGAQQLIQTIQSASKLHDRLKSQKELLAQEEQRQGRSASDLQQLFERLRLTVGDLQSLENLQSQYEKYREFEDQKRVYEQSLNAYQPEIVEFAASTTLHEVSGMLADTQAELVHLEDLREEYGESGSGMIRCAQIPRRKPCSGTSRPRRPWRPNEERKCTSAWCTPSVRR